VLSYKTAPVRKLFFRGLGQHATGAWTDATRTALARSLAPGSTDPGPLLRPSRGTHLVGRAPALHESKCSAAFALLCMTFGDAANLRHATHRRSFIP